MCEWIWAPSKSRKANPESLFTCENCGKPALSHIKYIEGGLALCIQRCSNVEEVSRKMLEFRGWEFIEVDKGGNHRVDFKCEFEHKSDLTFDKLRRGGNCKVCFRESLRKDKPKRDTRSLKTCNCKGVCEHYNHAVIFPDSAKEWSKRNGITPDQVFPAAGQKYYFKCGKCGEEYEQFLYTRAAGCRCPCNSIKLTPQKSLQFLFPNIAKDWSDENSKTADQVFAKSPKPAKWKCSTCSHKWEARILNRTVNKNGCPRCNWSNYDAMTGGYEYFEKKAREKYGNKYTYLNLDEYKDNKTVMKIECPKHGVFEKTAVYHLAGYECSKCSGGFSKGEYEIIKILEDLNIDYEIQKTFPDLKIINNLRCDFYIPSYNLVIEFDGAQHFKNVGWDKPVSEVKRNDCVKDLYLVQNEINLLRIPYTKINNIKDILNETFNILEKIDHVLYASYKEYIDKTKESIKLDDVLVKVVIL